MMCVVVVLAPLSFLVVVLAWCTLQIINIKSPLWHRIIGFRLSFDFFSSTRLIVSIGIWILGIGRLGCKLHDPQPSRFTQYISPACNGHMTTAYTTLA